MIVRIKPVFGFLAPLFRVIDFGAGLSDTSAFGGSPPGVRGAVVIGVGVSSGVDTIFGVTGVDDSGANGVGGSGADSAGGVGGTPVFSVLGLLFGVGSFGFIEKVLI